MDKSCFCGASPAVRVVSGNDLTVEALLSLYDRDSGVYKPLDLSEASDVSLRLVGTFSKVQGKDAAVAGSKVSALFPAGSLGVGVYGVEVTFKDSEGNGRAFERNLIGIVATSGEATTESSAEGDTGEGLNITVDVKTRTVRIGGSGSGVTDYTLLENKPKINEVTLDGNKTPEDLGLMPEGGAYTKEEADGKFETKTQVAAALASVTKVLDGCAKKTELPSKTSQLTNDSGFIDSDALAPYAKTDDMLSKLEKKADKADVEPYDCTWAFRLANGAAVTRDQVIELDTAIRSGRPLYVINYKEHTSSVIGMMDSSDDDYSEIVLLMYTYSSGGLRCVISDLDMVDEGHYMEANISYWGFQQRLVSGANIKTINGVSVLGDGDIKTPAPTKVSELENDKGYLTEHQSLDGYYQKADAQLDHRVVAEALVSLAARLDALEGSRGLLGDATAGTLDVRGLTKCRYPLVMLGHGVPAEANVPDNLPDGLPWDGVPAFVGQQYVNLDAPSGGLYYATGNEKVSDWKQA